MKGIFFCDCSETPIPIQIQTLIVSCTGNKNNYSINILYKPWTQPSFPCTSLHDVNVVSFTTKEKGDTWNTLHIHVNRFFL